MKKYLFPMLCMLLALACSGCGKAAASKTGAIFLKECGVTRSTLKGVDTGCLDSARFLDDRYYSDGAEKDFISARNAFLRVVDESSEALIPDRDLENFRLDKEVEGYYDKYELMFHAPGDTDPLRELKPEALIRRCLAVDRLAKERGISVSDEQYERYCSYYGVDTSNSFYAAWAKYRCVENELYKSCLAFPNRPLKDVADEANRRIQGSTGLVLDQSSRAVEALDAIRMNIRILSEDGNAVFEEEDVRLVVGYGILGKTMEDALAGHFVGDTVTAALSGNRGGFYDYFSEGTLEVTLTGIESWYNTTKETMKDRFREMYMDYFSEGTYNGI